MTPAARQNQLAIVAAQAVQTVISYDYIFFD